MPTDRQGRFFYDEPLKRLRAFGCDEIMCLYQALSSLPELSCENFFQIQHFDEFKYSKAGVPFLKKWTLENCIQRDLQAELELTQKLNLPKLYYVTHFEGSDFKTQPDLSNIPAEWTRIDIRAGITDSIFNWIPIIEGAQAIIAIDSVIANMTDQLQLKVEDKYWIPRSHIHLTPVLGTSWTILEAPEGTGASQKIFGNN